MPQCRWLASRKLLSEFNFGQGTHIAPAQLDWHSGKLFDSRPILQSGRILLFPDPGLKPCFLGLEQVQWWGTLGAPDDLRIECTPAAATSPGIPPTGVANRRP